MITDPPFLTVRRHFPRVSHAQLRVLSKAQTGHLVDAMDGRGALDFTIKPIDPKRSRFIGTALTCETGPSDNLAIFGALTLAERGDVVVAAADAFAGTAVIGDNLAMMAKNRGIAALVTDGMARDTAGIVKAALPVFARGVTPNSCVRNGPGRIGLPIVCGGVAVEAGDVIAGDEDGVVIVPRARIESVVDRLAKVIKAEKELQARIGQGLGVLDGVAELLRSERVHYLD
ncbi:MAG: hypothetical protein JO137_07425 [Hyphomicrobiales bacterium]|nr:hypothetical protein [Hyphomicrobiales bacterium]